MSAKPVWQRITTVLKPRHWAAALAGGLYLSSLLRAAHPVVSKVSPTAVRLVELQGTVLAGDSPWSLAVRYWGDGARWKELLAANPQFGDAHHFLMHPGQAVHVPTVFTTPLAPLPSIPMDYVPAPNLAESLLGSLKEMVHGMPLDPFWILSGVLALGLAYVLLKRVSWKRVLALATLGTALTMTTPHKPYVSSPPPAADRQTSAHVLHLAEKVLGSSDGPQAVTLRQFVEQQSLSPQQLDRLIALTVDAPLRIQPETPTPDAKLKAFLANVSWISELALSRHGPDGHDSLSQGLKDALDHDADRRYIAKIRDVGAALVKAGWVDSMEEWFAVTEELAHQKKLDEMGPLLGQGVKRITDPARWRRIRERVPGESSINLLFTFLRTYNAWEAQGEHARLTDSEKAFHLQATLASLELQAVQGRFASEGSWVLSVQDNAVQLQKALSRPRQSPVPKGKTAYELNAKSLVAQIDARILAFTPRKNPSTPVVLRSAA